MHFEDFILFLRDLLPSPQLAVSYYAVEAASISMSNLCSSSWRADVSTAADTA